MIGTKPAWGHVPAVNLQGCTGNQWVFHKGFFYSEKKVFLDWRKDISLTKRSLHPWSLTWNLKINPWKRRFLLETIIFRFHVKLWGCKEYKLTSMPGYFGNIPFFPGNITGKRPQLNQWMLSFLLPSVKSIWSFPQGISKKITQAWNKVFSWW